MYCTIIGNGSIRIRNGLEKLFFSANLVTAFMFVSLYSTGYSMHSLLDSRMKVDSFEELAKRDVTFYIDDLLMESKDFAPVISCQNLRKFGKSSYSFNRILNSIYLHICSEKLKKNVNVELDYNNGRFTGMDIETDKSMAFITVDYLVEAIVLLLGKQNRNCDVITEILGK